jgi:hypothetical protein
MKTAYKVVYPKGSNYYTGPIHRTLTYKIGKWVKVKLSKQELLHAKDKTDSCAPGINVFNSYRSIMFRYMRADYPGTVVLLIKYHEKDVICRPEVGDKIRLHRCKVIGLANLETGKLKKVKNARLRR